MAQDSTGSATQLSVNLTVTKRFDEIAVLVGIATAKVMPTVTSVTDNAGNTYSQRAGVQNDSNVRGEIWSAQHNTSASTVTVTVTISAGNKFAIIVAFYRGQHGRGNNAASTSNLVDQIITITKSQSARDRAICNVAIQGTIVPSQVLNEGVVQAQIHTTGGSAASNVSLTLVDGTSNLPNEDLPGVSGITTATTTTPTAVQSATCGYELTGGFRQVVSPKIQ